MDWERYAELVRTGIATDDDDPEFILGVVRRYDPKKNDSLAAFYRFCKARSPRWFPSASDTLFDKESRSYVDPTPGIVEATLDAELVRETVGQAGYAVLQLRHGEGLSVTQTAKRLGLSRASVAFIEAEAIRRASSLNMGD